MNKTEEKLNTVRVAAGKIKFWQDFKKFAFKGNLIDMSIGVIIGAAFGKIVSSLVADIFTPILSIFTNDIDFNNLFYALDGNTYATLAEAQEAGAATLNYGVFLSNIIDFLLVAVVLFFVMRAVLRARKKAETEEAAPAVPTTKQCPFCCTEIALEATRCPHCTSQL